MEHNGLAGQLGRIVLGEGDINILLLAGLHADQLILEAGDKAAGTDLQIKGIALAALESNAVVKALKVDVGGVALLDGALHCHQTAVAVSHLLETGVHVGGHDLHLSLNGLQALVLAQFHLGIHGDSALKHGAFLADALDLHLGIANDLQLLLVHGALVSVGQNGVDGFLIKDLGAVHALDHLAGRLAGTEAGNVHLTAHLQIRLVDGGLELLGAHLDGQSDSALFQFFAAFDSHCCFSSSIHLCCDGIRIQY